MEFSSFLLRNHRTNVQKMIGKWQNICSEKKDKKLGGNVPQLKLMFRIKIMV